jgi:azobenzene reductase
MHFLRDIYDLAERPLNQLDFSGTTPYIDEIKTNIKDFQEKVMAADFLVLGTPNYHGSSAIPNKLRTITRKCDNGSELTIPPLLPINPTGTLYLDDDQFQLRAKLFVDQIVSFVNNSPYEHLQ